jgi:hypothetical protein
MELLISLVILGTLFGLALAIATAQVQRETRPAQDPADGVQPPCDWFAGQKKRRKQS